ncbi:hypothetical protein [Tsukamurella sp. NPDC003166]|uniref:hypothetical protein n=1 Tax=Tsukamurella sp. NPDC003166 TaxID=3154444 RepID=UPI0033ACCAF3
MGDHSAPDRTPQPLAWLTPVRRRRAYAVIVALGAVLVLRGILSREEADAWLSVAEAALLGGTGVLALAHTPKARGE